MRTIKRIALVSLLALWVVSCASSLITNLTPSTLPRNPTGQYLVEMKMDSSQQTLRPETVSPAVIIGFNEYKMRPTLKMTNRWETYVPVPANQSVVLYHFKVNYTYNRFGKPGDGSLLTSEYRLVISE